MWHYFSFYLVEKVNKQLLQQFCYTCLYNHHLRQKVYRSLHRKCAGNFFEKCVLKCPVSGQNTGRRRNRRPTPKSRQGRDIDRIYIVPNGTSCEMGRRSFLPILRP